MTSISRSAICPAASLGRAIPAIAALSVQRAGGGMKSSTPQLARQLGEPLAKPRIRGHPSPHADPLHSGAANRLSCLGDDHVDDCLLKTGRQVADKLRFELGDLVPGVLAAERVEDCRLQAREAKEQPRVVQERARKRKRRGIATLGRPLDRGTAGITQAQQVRHLVECLSRGVVGRSTQKLAPKRIWQT